jgi:hypothetical protein
MEEIIKQDPFIKWVLAIFTAAATAGVGSMWSTSQSIARLEVKVEALTVAQADARALAMQVQRHDTLIGVNSNRIDRVEAEQKTRTGRIERLEERVLKTHP